MKEQDIRPDRLFKRYLELSAKDAKSMLDNKNQFSQVACLGCNSLNSKEAFTKNGFGFRSCLDCNSLYCSPRPSKKQLSDFCMSSDSAYFWAKEFFPAVADIRRQKLFKPKAKAIHKLFSQINFNPETISDVGAGYGVMLEEISSFWPQAKLQAIEPNKEFADICREKGFITLQETSENSKAWAGSSDLVLCFEVIEHVYSAEDFIRSLFELIKPGGYCLVSGLGSEGFDIQVLGAESNSVFPPHHINFLSIEGAKALFERAGFKNIDITTPGKLDVDIVKNMLKNKSDLDVGDWIETLFKRSEEACLDFQSFLARHNLSSHMWITAQRPH